MKQRIRPTIRVIVIVNTILFLEGSVEYLKKKKKDNHMWVLNIIRWLSWTIWDCLIFKLYSFEEA